MPHGYEFGDFRFDLEERSLISRHGKATTLTPRVFETLRYLVEHPGRVLDKEMLMEAVWPDCIVEENNLAQNISTLRRIFGDKPGLQRYIATVPGRGYRFLPEVRAEKNGGRATPAKKVAQASSLQETVRQAGSSRYFLPATALLLLSAVIIFFSHNSEPTPPPVFDKSIAVLPFANLSADPLNAYFAEGVKDEILTRLAHVSALKVISRTSTEEFAGKPHNVREIAQRLGVAHILEGSVQKSGETVRVTVQLIHAPSDTHLWAESFDRNLNDIFQVERDVAQRIAHALEAKLTGAEKQALTAQPTVNPEAHREYLQGRFFWNKRTSDGFREAIPHFRRALQLDPNYAQAQVGLADAIMFQGGDSLSDYHEAMKNSRELLEQALARDETLADAHASLGLMAMNYEWNWRRAEAEFQRAIELNPNYATAHHWYGEFLAYMGRFDEAIAEIFRARELDPLSLIINSDVGKVYCLARRYDDALAQFTATLRLDANFPEAHALMGMALSLMDRHAEAVAELRKTPNLETTPAYLAWLGFIYGHAGRTADLRAVVEQLRALEAQKYVAPFWWATLWAGAGERGEAFGAFERELVERPTGGVASTKVNPVFDSLRGDPRFQTLLRRAGFEL